MSKEQSPEQSLIELIHLFSDPAPIQLLKEKGALFEAGHSAPLRLALWLEYFLSAGAKELKENWASLSLEEQNDLGIELLKCYLFHPLFLRLSPEKPIKTTPFFLKKQEKLIWVEYEPGPDRKVRLFYPLVHHLIWPGLLIVLKENVISSEDALIRFQSAMKVAASSSLDTIQERVETLRSLFFNSSKGIESKPQNPLGTDPIPTAPSQPKTKRIRKKSNDQLNLF